VQKKNNFQILSLIAIEMAVLSVLLEKKGLGPLGVKVPSSLSKIWMPEYLTLEGPWGFSA